MNYVHHASIGVGTTSLGLGRALLTLADAGMLVLVYLRMQTVFS